MHAWIREENPTNLIARARGGASDIDAVVRARMVRKISIVDGGDSASDGARVPVVFAGDLDPFSAILDVDLTTNLVVPE